MTNEWVPALFAALEGKIPKDYVGQIADHLPIGLCGLYPRLEVEKLTTMFKEREDTIHHLERKCDLLMARVRELSQAPDHHKHDRALRSMVTSFVYWLLLFFAAVGWLALSVLLSML